MIAASPPLYLLAAKGIRNINYSYAKLAVIAIIVILSAANLQTYYTTTIKAQAREATGFVNENAKNGDLVVFFSGSGSFDPVLSYYSFVAGLNVTRFPSCSTGQGLASNIKELQSDINGHNRVWFIVQGYSYADSYLQVLNQTVQTFHASYNETYHKTYYGYDVYLFERPA